MALKIGFIGVGSIAQAHMANVTARERTRITAVCDVNEEVARAVAEEREATPYTNHQEMLEAEELDAAYVCVPPACHASIELDLVESRTPFCVQKPVNLDLQAAARVANAVRNKGLVTSVGYQVRYAPQAQEAVQFLSGRHISLVEGWLVGGLPPTPWWRRKAISGGQIVEQSTHIYDLARFIAGEVVQVAALGTTGAFPEIKDYDIEDASVALLQFESGAVGHITTACILGEGGAPRSGLSFDGRGFTVKVTYSSLAVHTADGTREEDYAGSLGPALQNLDSAFLNAVETGDTSDIVSDYESGLKSLALGIAANESLEKGGAPVSPAELLKAAGF